MHNRALAEKIGGLIMAVDPILRKQCKAFIRNKQEFKWFLIKYFGIDQYHVIVNAAYKFDPVFIQELTKCYNNLPKNLKKNIK